MVQGSGDARMQPLYFLITTAGNNTESICYEVHQKALDIMEGRKHDSTFYPVIFGAGVDEDWTNPEVGRKPIHLLVKQSELIRLKLPVNQQGRIRERRMHSVS